MAGLFVGRRRELDIARQAIEAVPAGHGSVVVVSGQSGIGKTRFAREVGDTARGLGCRVVWGASWPDGDAPPYWPWQAVLDALDPGAGRVLELAPGGEATRFDRFRAVTETLANASAQQPLVVTLDDVQALDADGLLLTRFVARSTGSVPLLLLLTAREGPELSDATAAMLADIEREGTVLRLEGLDRREVATLVVGRGLPHDEEAVHRVCRLTDGVPFLVEQVLDTGAHDGALPVPERARHFLDARLDHLDPPTRRVLEAAAVLGPNASRYELATVGDADPLTIARARDAAIAAGLVAADHGDALTFSHELARETVLARIDRDRLVDLHRRCIATLGRDAGSIERVTRRARHALALAGQSPDDTDVAIETARDSARVLTAHGSPEAAVELLTDALAAHEATSTTAAAPLLCELGFAMLATGRLAAARDVFGRAVEVADAAGDVRMYARAAIGLGGVQVQEQRADEDRRAYHDVLRRAVERLGGDESDEATCLRASLRLRLAAERASLAGVLDEARAALEAVRATRSPRDLAAGLSMFHALVLGPAFAHERLGIATEMLDVARACGDELHTVIGLLWRAVDVLLLGRDAERALAEVRARADALGMRSILYLTDAIGVMQLMRAGEMKAAERAANAALERGIEVGDPDTGSYFGAHTLALSWYAGHAVELLDVAEQLASSTAIPDENPVFYAVVAALAAEAGDRDRAERALAVLGRGRLREVLATSSWLVTMFVLADAAVHLDDGPLAAELYGLLEPYADLPVMASLGIACFGSTSRPLGLAAGVLGRVDDAVAHLERAIVQDQRLGNRPMLAITRVDLAETLRRRGRDGDRERAAALLDQAIDAAERMELEGRLGRWRALRAALADTPRPAGASCTRTGDAWEIVAGDERARVPHTVGMAYLATLLAAPGVEIAAGTLAGVDLVSPKQDVFDDETRRALRRRVDELEAALDDAAMRGDDTRASALQRELDAVLDHARGAAGLAGRSRHFDDSAERARTSVQKAIRRAIGRIAGDAPALAATLGACVRTGYQCSYEPAGDAPRRWVVRSS